jgi:hypothetical protein
MLYVNQRKARAETWRKSESVDKFLWLAADKKKANPFEVGVSVMGRLVGWWWAELATV